MTEEQLRLLRLRGPSVDFRNYTWSSSFTAQLHDMWQRQSPSLSAAPSATAGVALDSTAAPALKIKTPGAGETLYVTRAEYHVYTSTSSLPFNWLLYDRLLHSDGIQNLSANNGVAQTVNTVALPSRGGTGVGVLGGVICWNGGNNSAATTMAISYTNSSGVAGRTGTLSGAVDDPGMLRPFSLQAGDVGVQSVQSVTITGSNGTNVSSNIGVCLFKPVVYGSTRSQFTSEAQQQQSGHSQLELGLPVIDSAACLSFALTVKGSFGTNTQTKSLLETASR